MTVKVVRCVVEDFDLERQEGCCLVSGMFRSGDLLSSADRINTISGGYIDKLVASGDLGGNLGDMELVRDLPNLPSKRLLICGCGERGNVREESYLLIVSRALERLMKRKRLEKIVMFLHELCVEDRDIYWKVRWIAESVEGCAYEFSDFKTIRDNSRDEEQLTVAIPVEDRPELCRLAVEHGSTIGTGVRLAKDLSNTPPNVCTPRYLEDKSSELSACGVSVDIIDSKQIAALGMNAYLAVSGGSSNRPSMIILRYRGHEDVDARPVVMIGKGVTFDTGGLSMKPSDRMGEMKFDMCGAAAIYGLMYVAAKLELNVNIIGVMASCENMPGSNSYRPGDVVRTLSGRSVEVTNTDAEGRLVLSDVLSYVGRFNPDVVIDIATLTGACVVALGQHITGLFSNDDLLAEEILLASRQSGDQIWRLPMGDKFQEQLKSKVADLVNTDGGSGGAITAACFLSRFAEKYRWAHLDIAGTAWKAGSSDGATGRPVPAVAQFLMNYRSECPCAWPTETS